MAALISICVIKEANHNISEDELLDYGLEKLAKYKAPKKVHFLDSYPRTKNGKVLRKQLIQEIQRKGVN